MDVLEVFLIMGFYGEIFYTQKNRILDICQKNICAAFGRSRSRNKMKQLEVDGSLLATFFGHHLCVDSTNILRMQSHDYFFFNILI